MKPYSRNLWSELSATPVIGPVVAGDSTTAKKGRRYLVGKIAGRGCEQTLKTLDAVRSSRQVSFCLPNDY